MRIWSGELESYRCWVNELHNGEWTDESGSPLPGFHSEGQIPNGEPDLLIGDL